MVEDSKARAGPPPRGPADGGGRAGETGHVEEEEASVETPGGEGGHHSVRLLTAVEEAGGEGAG